MSEWMDVADLLRAFAMQNEVTMTVQLVSITSAKGPDLLVLVTATYPSKKNTEVMLSDSVSVKCSVLNVTTLSAAITRALYAMDAQLALNEFGIPDNKKA